MSGEAYKQSSVVAEQCPPLEPASDLMQTNRELIAGAACPGFYLNREPFLDVIRMHRASVNKIGADPVGTGNSHVETGFQARRAEQRSAFPAQAQLKPLIEASKTVW